MDDSRAIPLSAGAAGSGEGWALTEVITRLRRALRSSVREEFAWESLPMAQVEFLQRLSSESGLRIVELARKHRMATNTVSASCSRWSRPVSLFAHPIRGIAGPCKWN